MERDYSIDFLKFFAIFAVVCIHTGTVSGVHIGNIDGDQLDFLIDITARFAVPFFFVTSGYLFIRKLKQLENKNDQEVTSQQNHYFYKYTTKLIKLWAAWFIFYFLFDLLIKYVETEKTSASLISMVKEHITSIFTWDLFYYGAGQNQYHLWFLLALIWSVMILFVAYKTNMLKTFLLIGLGLNILGMFGQSYSFIYDMSWNTRDALFFGMFYMLLGGFMGSYILKVRNLAKRVPTTVFIGVSLLFVFLQIGEASLTVQVAGGKEQNFFLSTIPLTIILFMLIMKHNQVGKNTIVSKIGANSVGIYVSHVFVMETLRILMNRMGLELVMETLAWKLAFTPAVFILAYLFYIGVQKMKDLDTIKEILLPSKVPVPKRNLLINTNEKKS
ncbi:acyltransferase [Virgibacillus halodenitrificans]|uniref:acyltransferase n=1 Tax=Virgibacillus halodenitrificans TaxID=1482 RepID=UPI000762157E